MKHIALPVTILSTLVIFFLLTNVAGAQSRSAGLVVCGNSSSNSVVSDADMCKYADVIEQVRVIINFLLFKLAAPLAALMFAYAGFIYVTNGGNEGKIKEAHEIFWNVFLGLVVALGAWAIVSFILGFLLGDGSAFNLLKK